MLPRLPMLLCLMYRGTVVSSLVAPSRTLCRTMWRRAIKNYGQTSLAYRLEKLRDSPSRPALMKQLFACGTNTCRMRNMALSMSTDALTTTLSSGSHVSEIVVKKSRFIGYAKHVETWKEAQGYLELVHKEHPKARHVCFGFVAGSNPVQERCSDGGEPTGTAGLPILGAVKGEGLSDSICMVVRYFGGTKLGAGGLIRAYGGAARQVLREAPKEVLIPKSAFRVSVELKYAGAVYDAVAKAGGVAGEEEYTAIGDVFVTVTCATEQVNRTKEQIQDTTRGSADFL